MMGFMVEIVITAFAFGGVLGAVVALHLSANLKQTEDVRRPASVSLERSHPDEPAELKPVPVDVTLRRATGSKKHHH